MKEESLLHARHKSYQDEYNNDIKEIIIDDCDDIFASKRKSIDHKENNFNIQKLQGYMN